MFDRKKLRQQIVQLLSDSELKTLCFDLNVDYDILEGGQKETKVVSLISYLEKRGRLPDLLNWLTDERPHVNWQQFLEVKTTAEPASPQSPSPTLQPPSVPPKQLPTIVKSPISNLQSPFWTMPYGEPDWVEIPAGEFWMGSDKGEDNEKPVHRLYLDTFLIARTPVTNAQYALFVQARNHRAPDHWQVGKIPPGLENHPVVRVSWDDVMAYCRWLSQMTDKTITLPGEAEWEKAARGNKDKREYLWGDTFDPKLTNTKESGIGKTTPIGSYPDGASPYGMLDLCGNVWEWTRSEWKPYPYRPYDGRENLQANVQRVVRGGSYYFDKTYARCSYRGGFYPDYRLDYGGFRVAVSPFSPSGR